MRRSGSTWQYQVARSVLGGLDAKWVIWQDFDELVEKCENDEIPVVVCKVHPFLPFHCKTPNKLVSEGRFHPIYIYRDLRDVFASMKVFHGKIERLSGPTNWVSELSSLTEVDRQWRRMSCTYVARYEDAIYNPQHEIMRMAKHFEIDITPSAATAIAELWSLENNRERMLTAAGKSNDLLWHHHIQNGGVGRWKEELSERDSKMIHQEFGYWLKENGYIS